MRFPWLGARRNLILLQPRVQNPNQAQEQGTFLPRSCKKAGTAHLNLDSLHALGGGHLLCSHVRRSDQIAQHQLLWAARKQEFGGLWKHWEAHTENLREISASLLKKSWQMERALKTEVAIGRQVLQVFLLFLTQLLTFLQEAEFNNYYLIMLLLGFTWISTQETSLPTGRFFSRRILFPASHQVPALWSQTWSSQSCFQPSISTLEAFAVVLLSPDRDIQLRGLRREPSKLSSTSSAITE